MDSNILKLHRENKPRDEFGATCLGGKERVILEIDSPDDLENALMEISGIRESARITIERKPDKAGTSSQLRQYWSLLDALADHRSIPIAGTPTRIGAADWHQVISALLYGGRFGQSCGRYISIGRRLGDKKRADLSALIDTARSI